MADKKDKKPKKAIAKKKGPKGSVTIMAGLPPGAGMLAPGMGPGGPQGRKRRKGY